MLEKFKHTSVKMNIPAILTLFQKLEVLSGSKMKEVI